MVETVPIAYTFVVDRGYQKSVAAVMQRNVLRSPRRIVLVALCAAAVLLGLFVLPRTPALTVALVAAAVILVYSQTRGQRIQAERYVASVLPLSETFGIGFGTSAVAQRGRSGSSQTSYAQVIGISRVGGLVEVKYADKRLSYYPHDLIPQEVIDMVNRTIVAMRTR